ncbi:retrovirus-related pol polyprotein from transposon TNT 1-94 [Tanacetum coccineum]
MSSSSSSTHNMAFVSSSNNNTSSSNDVVNAAHGVTTASTQVNTAYFTNINNLSDVVICSFFASQPNSPQLVHEDFFDKSKVECYNCHKRGFQKQFPPTNNQLRTSSNSRTHATVHDGHIVTEPVQRKALGNVGNTGARGKKVICYNCRGEGHVARQCKEPKRKTDSQYFKDKALLMEAKEKGDVLDAEAEAFLADVECTAPYDQPQALTTTNVFQANHEDAYDSDVDEGPNATVAFMANLSSTSATNNPVNEVHSIIVGSLFLNETLIYCQLCGI